MPSSSRVIKATDAPAANLFKVTGLADFSADGIQTSTAESPREDVLTANSGKVDKNFNPDISWTTGKSAGGFKEKSQMPIHSWVVSDFHKEAAASTGQPQQTVSSVTSQVDDHFYLIEEAKTRADEIISEAEKNASAILSQAQTEAAAIKQNAFSEGMTASRNEMSQTLHQVERLFQETQLWQEQVMRQSQTRIIEMVLSIGKKLFGGGFELPAEQIDHIVSRAINEASRLGNLRVYLNPEDAKLLVNLWQESELTLNGQQIQIVSSQNISRGGCFIDGEFGVLDGRMEEQFDQINKSIKSAETNLEVEE
jgi:flagellar biosynthesis/type III secretory pathway protein FliH